MPRDYQVLPDVPWSVLGVISAGGVIGALARYGLIAEFPEPDRAFGAAEVGMAIAQALSVG